MSALDVDENAAIAPADVAQAKRTIRIHRALVGTCLATLLITGAVAVFELFPQLLVPDPCDEDARRELAVLHAAVASGAPLPFAVTPTKAGTVVEGARGTHLVVGDVVLGSTIICASD